MSGHVTHAVEHVEPVETFDKGSIDYDVLAYLIQLYGSAQGQRLHQDLRQKRWIPQHRLTLWTGVVLASAADLLRRRLQQADTGAASWASLQGVLEGAVSGIHILPFSVLSDDGFAVVDYRQVRSDLGDWATSKIFLGSLI